MLSLSCIIRYASNLRKSVEIFENLTLLLEKKTRWFIIRIKRAAVQYLHIDKSGYLIFAVPAQWKTKEKDVKTCTRNENTNILSYSVLSLTFWQWYFWDIVIWTGKFRMKYTLTKIQDLTFPRFPIFLLYLSEIQSLLPGKAATNCLADFLEK